MLLLLAWPDCQANFFSLRVVRILPSSCSNLKTGEIFWHTSISFWPYSQYGRVRWRGHITSQKRERPHDDFRVIMITHEFTFCTPSALSLPSREAIDIPYLSVLPSRVVLCLVSPFGCGFFWGEEGREGRKVS